MRCPAVNVQLTRKTLLSKSNISGSTSAYPAARRDYERREAAMVKKKNPQTDDSFADIVSASKDSEIDELKSMDLLRLHVNVKTNASPNSNML